MGAKPQDCAAYLNQPQTNQPIYQKANRAVMLRKLASRIAAAFTAEDWAAVTPLVTNPSLITNHHRLLQSLHFGDDDYEWNIQEVLMSLDEESPDNIDALKAYLSGFSPQHGVPSLGERILKEGESVRFKCDRDLVFVRELGRGGTGRTMLFKDETADLLFAIKKYDPTGSNDAQECYERFVQETLILLKISHPHVVRIYNYYFYPHAITGYIQMEYVDGVPINQFQPTSTMDAVQVFADVISAFEAIEAAGVLHRDVRPSNILVTNDGTVKLIDFGFGKKYAGESSLAKNSVCLNWPFEPPLEVSLGKYDRATEVYYVGKLFEYVLGQWDIKTDTFPFTEVITGMTRKDPSARYRTFSAVRAAMIPSRIEHGLFDEMQLDICRAFLDTISEALSELDPAAVLVGEPEELLRRLDKLLDSCSLEIVVPDVSLLLDCVIDGTYSFRSYARPTIDGVREFRNLFVRLTQEQQHAVMRNIAVRVDLVPRREGNIPF